jgi:autotransporter translocation and assembly factor TamB
MTRSIVLALALAFIVPTAGWGQASDLAGTWNLAVDVNGNVTTPKLTLTQSADTLSGTYSSETLGDAEVSGMVEGTGFTLSFSAEMQGQPIPVRYAGTLQEDGTLSGTMELAGGQITGTFTAKREDGVAPN